MRLRESSAQDVVQEMVSSLSKSKTTLLAKNKGPAALLTLLFDYLAESGDNQTEIRLGDFWRHHDYKSSAENWLLEEYLWRSKKAIKNAYQVILQDISKLRDGGFILYEECIGYGANTITITKKGTRWVVEAQSALEEVYDQSTDPIP